VTSSLTLSFSPLEFCLWSYLKAKVSVTHPANIPDSKQRIQLCTKTIYNDFLQSIMACQVARSNEEMALDVT
jgi:hypothetical protein